jgi:hypothetical protein
MFVEMNIDNEPLFVVNQKTLKGAVGPKIGMNVARLSAALAKKPVFFLDRNESVEQEIVAGGAGGRKCQASPPTRGRKERENMQWQNTVKEMPERKLTISENRDKCLI